VYTFNSVTRNSTARPMCCVRTYQNTFKHDYYTNSKLRLLVATCYKKM
jgi:oxalate decarboxylase/phosphoglucose isomerase-like protein (cupin superfamily)